MIEELKPCPFCGGRAVICFNTERPELPMYWMVCRDCHASPGDLGTEAEAIALWNTRTAYDPDKRLREVTPAMASAGMHVLAAMPDHCDWIALAKYAAVIWRAMYDAALSHNGG